MKHTLLTALAVSALVVGCAGSGNSRDNAATPAPALASAQAGSSAPSQTVQPRFDYAGVWMEHEDRCKWSHSAGQYALGMEVMTRVDKGLFQRADVDRYFTDAQCSGEPVRSVTTSVEYLYVVGQGRLANGTAVDMIQKTAQIGGAVRERCVAFVQDGKLFDECSKAPRPFPTRVVGRAPAVLPS